jgi:hypothetical protein
MAPTNELFHAEKYFPTERISWVRKHHIENEFYSDEELHVQEYPSHEKQTLDRLKVSRAVYIIFCKCDFS